MYDLSKIPVIDKTVRIPVSEYGQRCEKLRKVMAERNIDIGLAYATQCMPGDVLYLTGYDSNIENSCLLITQDKLFVLVGPEGSYMARQNVKYGDYRIVEELQIPTEEYVNTPSTPARDIIHEIHPGKIKTIGLLTRGDVLTLDCVKMIKDNVPDDVKFVEAGDIIYNMRVFKSVNELAVLRVANRITIEGVKAMCESIEDGMTELEVTAVGDYVMKKMGAYAFGFDTFLSSGYRSNTIMDRGSNKVIKNGEEVCVGTSARYEGYASTARRMWVCGGFDKKHIEYYEKLAKAQEIAAENFKYGLPKNGIEKAVWAHWKRLGLFEYKIYSVAHGTGISECMEGIAFTMKTEDPIPKNLAMMLDTGLYCHPEFNGASIENAYIINEKGETEWITSDYPNRNWLLY
jgi:Xaa-Pro aminopeptidase